MFIMDWKLKVVKEIIIIIVIIVIMGILIIYLLNINMSIIKEKLVKKVESFVLVLDFVLMIDCFIKVYFVIFFKSFEMIFFKFCVLVFLFLLFMLFFKIIFKVLVVNKFFIVFISVKERV